MELAKEILMRVVVTVVSVMIVVLLLERFAKKPDADHDDCGCGCNGAGGCGGAKKTTEAQSNAAIPAAAGNWSNY